MARRVRKKKGSFKKKLLIGAALSLLGVVGGIYLLATTYVTRNYLSERIEEKYNLRFEIGEIDLSVFRPTAVISLSDVKVAERDSFANDGMAHDDRPPLTKSVLELGNLTVRVSLLDLLSRNLQIESLELDGVKANGILYKDGTNNIEKLLVRIDEEERAEEDGGDTFNARSNSDFITNLRDIKLSNVELNLTVEASRLLVKAKDIDLKLNKQLAMNPDKLGEMSPADFDLSAKVEFYSQRQDMHYGMLDVKGKVVGSLFNAETGDFDPDVNLNLALMDKSHFKKIPVIEKSIDSVFGSKNLPFLRKWAGKKWPETFLLDKARNMECRFFQNKVSFLAPVEVNVGDWSLVLGKDSWLETKEATHEFNLNLIASESISSKLVRVAKFLPSAALKPLMQNDRLRVELMTYESLSRPRFKLKSDLSLLKGAGGDALKELEDEVKGRLLDLLK